ncbi:MAG: DUF4340 domain-containing protein [Oscillospiraceae bacterium]|nr:DUF4340 domain-containing protein [Oscillospiraceae bacterium]
MNRSKKLYTLLGVLIAACAATFAVMRMEEHKERIKNSDEIILELPSESVCALSWEYSGETLAFHKDGAWLYDEDENFPVSEEKINGLLEQFQAFGAAFIIEDVEDYGQYGLDAPVCTIHLSTEEQSYEIKLGDYSTMDSQRYISIGDGNVYLVKHDPLDDFDADLSDMIHHDEIPSFDHVTKLRFAGAESYTIAYEENSAGTYSADDVYFTGQDGKDLPLDTSKVSSYLRGISALNPVDYVSYNVTDEELKTYGLDAPELTITVDYTAQEDDAETANTFVLYVSPDPEETNAAEEGADTGQDAEIPAYIRIGESQIIYRISPSSYKKLAAASYNDLRHAEVIWADFADVRQIGISLEGDDYTLASREDGSQRVWLYQEKEVDAAGLWDDLAALAASEFTSEQPTQKEEISLTIYLDNENFPEIRIALYRYDGTYCLAVVNGESVSLVERAAVVDLIEAVHSIVLN